MRWPSTRSSAAWPRELGATAVVEPGELRRAVRRATGSWILDSGQLTGGAEVVFDCVGSAESIGDALAVAAPGGTVVLLGMPGHVGVDLTGCGSGRSAWPAPTPTARSRRRAAGTASTWPWSVVEAAGLDRLVSATYPLDRYAEAIEHAASAGRRGAVKVAFDLRPEKRR